MTTSHPRQMEGSILEPLQASPARQSGIAGWSRRQLLLVPILGVLFTLGHG